MFPYLLIFGFAVPTPGLLLGCGLLAALATAERLAAKLRLPPNRVWTAAVLGTVSLPLGERLVLFAASWQDFVAHPTWMLGLLAIRDSRLFYAGVCLALVVVSGYLRACHVPLGRATEALAPAATSMLAFAHASYFAEGAEPGRVCAPRWGVVCGNHMAQALYGTPLGVPLIPVAAYACAGYAVAALAGAWTAGRSGTGVVLLLGGLVAVLAGQGAIAWAGEPLVLGVFTWAQAAGAVSTMLGAGVLLRR